jgi:hypothetical protein
VQATGGLLIKECFAIVLLKWIQIISNVHIWRVNTDEI